MARNCTLNFSLPQIDGRTTVPLLLGLGVRELSVNAAAVAAVKQAVRGTDLTEAAELARQAVGLPSAEAVRELMRRRPGGDVAC